MRDTVLALVGGCVVYAAMAACSSGAMTTGPASSGKGQTAGTPGTSGAPGTTSGSPGTTAGGGGMVAGGQTTSGGGMGSMGSMGSMMSPVPPASADPTDGTRLKAVYRTAADGSKESVAGLWFDSMRMETCSFTTAADGMERCLPSDANAASLVYADASCTMQVVSAGSGCAPAYVAVPDSSSGMSCGASAGAVHIYSVGASTTPSNLYVSAAGMCFALGQVPMAAYYMLGSEVSPSSFVSATTSHM
jgi:hypothetical protein